LIDGVPKMSPRMQKQIAKSREQALAAFVSKKAEIDEMLTRLPPPGLGVVGGRWCSPIAEIIP
jgi:hypothetical protein